MVMAKGVEDTAFYRYTRFVALNEVGGDPDRFGVDVGRVPRALATAREAGWPAAMTTLSTHDTKRSEDVRARLAVLAELPGELADAVAPLVGAPRPIDEPALNLPGLADAGRRMADQRGPAARLPGQGGQGGQGPHDLDRPRRRRTSSRAGLAGRGTRRHRADGGRRPRSSRGSSRPGWSNSLRPEAAPAHRARRARRLPGHRAVGLVAGRPGQPPAGGLRARAASSWPGSPTASCRTIDASGAAKLLVAHQALRLRRDQPELFRGYRPLPRRRRRPPSTRSRSTAARDLVAVATRLPVGLAAGGGWRRHRAAAARRRRGPTCSPAAVDGGAGCWPSLLDRVPGRAAGAGARERSRVWAPEPTRRVRVRGRRRRARDDRAATAAGGRPTADAGTDYAFLLDDDDDAAARPASRWQPDGVHGPSRVVRPRRVRLDRRRLDRPAAARRRRLRAAHRHVHPSGTFDAAIERLDHLVDLGVTTSSCCRSPPSPAARLGLRRRALVRGARALRRAGRLQAVRRRLPRARPRRRARRRLQPPRAVAATT